MKLPSEGKFFKGLPKYVELRKQGMTIREAVEKAMNMQRSDFYHYNRKYTWILEKLGCRDWIEVVDKGLLEEAIRLADEDAKKRVGRQKHIQERMKQLEKEKQENRESESKNDSVSEVVNDMKGKQIDEVIDEMNMTVEYADIEEDIEREEEEVKPKKDNFNWKLVLLIGGLALMVGVLLMYFVKRSPVSEEKTDMSTSQRPRDIYEALGLPPEF